MARSRQSPAARRPLPLLAGLTPAQFMRRHWQKKPLLVRGAMRGFTPLLTRAELFALAGHDDVESRLVVRTARDQWTLEEGPIRRSALPPVRQPGWTLLVQGVDSHADAAHALLRHFCFLPDARLDDLMISWASDGGGVGPHVDSYDVFLLQAQGRRRWRIGPQRDRRFVTGLPLKILRRFTPTEEHLLGPGDMLYLPPDWAHEGVAEGGDCMTYSIGMRAPRRGELAAEIATRLADDHDDALLYRDRRQTPIRAPAEIPRRLQSFATAAVRRLVGRPGAVLRALGEVSSEPKPGVWFERPPGRWRLGPVELDRRTRMLYDARHVFINGEAVRVRGADAALLRRLANERCLDAHAVRTASAEVRALLRQWFEAAWLRHGG